MKNPGTITEFRAKKFNEKLLKWKEERKLSGEPYSDEVFRYQFNPEISRQTIANWKNGEEPNSFNKTQLCKIFNVNDDYFDTITTREDLNKFDTVHITKVGKENASFAVEHGLDLDLVQVLHELVDFDSLFPKYSHIVEEPSSSPDNPRFIREENADSAVIDKDLEFLQIKRDGKIYTMHQADLAYLKEVQDKVKEYVEFLFYKRSKEMKEEVQRCIKGLESYEPPKYDQGLEYDGQDLEDDLKQYRKTLIRVNDRFYKHATKASQKNIEEFFGHENKKNRKEGK